MSTIAPPLKEPAIPLILRLLGARYRSYPRTFRMKWGEVSFGDAGFAFGIHLFGDPVHFSLNIHLPWLFNVYVRLAFLQRFAREPEEMMETWGISYSTAPATLWLRWGARYKLITMPWCDWHHVSTEVLLPDGTWAPEVNSWERDKTPDGRHTETHPYNYLLRNGEVQRCTATIFVERRTWRLRRLRFIRKSRTSIDVSFSEEMGEGRGSWKGGTLGCGYDLKPNETPRECLKRMERERRFDR
jgi:hypothetical protein